jgi:hypothetical protein
MLIGKVDAYVVELVMLGQPPSLSSRAQLDGFVATIGESPALRAASVILVVHLSIICI